MALFFASCNYADMGGMFVVEASVNQRFEQSVQWNSKHSQKNIEVQTDNYKFFVAADVHVGQTQNFEYFIAQAQANNANAMVLVGDISNGNVFDYEKIVAALPEKNLMPWYMTAGNHELYFDGWKHYFKFFGSSTYYFYVETPAAKDLYICVDTGAGTIGSKQLSWLKNLLENEREKYRRCVIFTHNNLFRARRTASTNPVVEELHVFAQLFAQHKVDYVITGHDHLQNVLQFGNTTHVTLDAMYDGFIFASYFVLEAKEGVLNYKFVDIPE